MPKISEMTPPGPLSGLELAPLLQGGGTDGNVGVPILAFGNLPRGDVLVLRAPMVADMSATADADPGAGNLRWNNADPDLATVLFVDDADSAAADLATVLATLQVGGFAYVQRATDALDDDARDTWQKWQVTSNTDAAGYTKLGVTLQDSSGAFADDDVLEVTFQQPTPSPGVDRNVVTAAIPSAGVVPIDCSLGDYFTLAPTANVTGWSITNVPPACSILVRFTQDATPRTVAWPASFRWAGGTDGVVSTGSGVVDLLALTTFDAGTTWQATLAKDFAA
jgi:hypothetical protein